MMIMMIAEQSKAAASAALLVVALLIASNAGASLGAPASAGKPVVSASAIEVVSTARFPAPAAAVAVGAAAASGTAVASAGASASEVVTAASEVVKASLVVETLMILGSLAKPSLVYFHSGLCGAPSVWGRNVQALLLWDVTGGLATGYHVPCVALQAFASADCSGVTAGRLTAPPPAVGNTHQTLTTYAPPHARNSPPCGPALALNPSPIPISPRPKPFSHLRLPSPSPPPPSPQPPHNHQADHTSQVLPLRYQHNYERAALDAAIRALLLPCTCFLLPPMHSFPHASHPIPLAPSLSLLSPHPSFPIPLPPSLSPHPSPPIPLPPSLSPHPSPPIPLPPSLSPHPSPPMPPPHALSSRQHLPVGQVPGTLHVHQDACQCPQPIPLPPCLSLQPIPLPSCLSPHASPSMCDHPANICQRAKCPPHSNPSSLPSPLETSPLAFPVPSFSPFPVPLSSLPFPSCHLLPPCISVPIIHSHLVCCTSPLPMLPPSLPSPSLSPLFPSPLAISSHHASLCQSFILTLSVAPPLFRCFPLLSLPRPSLLSSLPLLPSPPTICYAGNALSPAPLSLLSSPVSPHLSAPCLFHAAEPSSATAMLSIAAETSPLQNLSLLSCFPYIYSLSVPCSRALQRHGYAEYCYRDESLANPLSPLLFPIYLLLVGSMQQSPPAPRLC
ncbi:unnamed protein product [Closterium sp. NIES-64]|nr:unnamed protein product [Closterium sp. NIES-64]